MKQAIGWWFPDHEQHMIEWMTKANDKMDGRLAYQGRKIRAVLEQVTDFRHAVDVGGHVGLWSYYLGRRFATVTAFEPVEAHRECFIRNVDMTNVSLLPYALGESDGMVSMNVPHTSSGGTTVAGPGDIPMKRLDDCLHFADVGLIKLDCEGFELNVLKGGEQMIQRCRPVVIVEQKPGMAQRFGLQEIGAVDWLKARGYRVVKELGGDFILVSA